MKCFDYSLICKHCHCTLIRNILNFVFDRATSMYAIELGY